MQHAFRGSRMLSAVFWTCALITFGVFSAGSSAKAVTKKGHKASGRLSITVRPWGSVGGQNVNLYTLRNRHGMRVAITNYGGVVQAIRVPDRSGGVKNVALGFSSLSDYVNDFTQGATKTPFPLAGGSGDTYFGAIIGRYANRIANHSFSLNNQTYTLDSNNGVNTLHGGYLGWNTQVWSATPLFRRGSVALQLTQLFPAGEGCLLSLSPGCTGFPAPVQATVTYSLNNNNALKISYNAINESSSLATVINLTNHTYFNLAGEGSGTVYDQQLAINANQYQPVDANLIPTNFASVAHTAYDFRNLKAIGRDIRRATLPDGGTQPISQLVIAHGYDNNWVLNGSGFRLAAVAADPKTGIVLSTFTDQPGVQFYSGNFLVGDLVGTSGRTYRQTDGFTLETQHYPDAPHHIGDPAWPSVVLNPNGTFNSTTTYAFRVARGVVHRHF